MSVLTIAHPISVSDQSVSVGLNCIDTPKLWIGDILQTQNQWYIDIAFNDDGPTEEYSRMLAMMYTGQA